MRQTSAAGAIATLLYNVLPVLGVLVWGWDAFALLFLYWIENVAIGVRTEAQLIAAGAAQRQPEVLFIAPFFALHYGLFCFGHGVFVAMLFGGRDVESSPFALGAIAVELAHANVNFALALAGVVLWQIGEFALFAARGDIQRTPPRDLMGAPYPRIIVLHVTIILSGFALMWIGAPKVAVVLLALLKSFGEAWFSARANSGTGAAKPDLMAER